MDSTQKPLVIPVFIPHSGCPHKCAFCNQSIITSQTEPLPDKAAIQAVVTRYLWYKGLRTRVELAFFGGNFLGLAPGEILRLLNWVQPYIAAGKIDGIRFSTRPDTISQETLTLLEPYKISGVELGVQSMNDAVLQASRRGHTARDTLQAIRLLKERSFNIGVQVMVGLPGDHEASLLESTRQVARLSPDFVRIYPLMVLKGSPMALWYKTGRYTPLTLGESIGLVKKMVPIFRAAHVDIIRMGLQASDMMEDDTMVLAGPWHPAFGHLVFSEMIYDQVCEKIEAFPGLSGSGKIVLTLHPRAESRLRGDKNMNLKKLNTQYPGHRFSFRMDDRMPMDQVEVGQP